MTFFKILLILPSVVLPLAGPALAQVAAPSSARPANGISYSAANIIYRASGIRLEGSATQPAKISSPEMDIQAGAIAFDLAGNALTEVRALGKVRFKMTAQPKAGGQPLLVNANADSAVLVRQSRQLTLKGNINGFYQLASGGKVILKGDTGVFTYGADRVLVDVTGGREPMVLTLPAEAIAKAGSLGEVTVTGKNFAYDSVTGVARLTGGARAVSAPGPTQFDVSAPEFQLTRGADGTISLLKCVGRTQMKATFPPSVPAAPRALPQEEIGGEKGATGPVGKTSTTLGRPTRVEASGDGAVIDRAASTMVFEGNVRGFYTLSGGTGTAASGAQNFNFAGSKASFRYNPTGAEDPRAGLSVEVLNANIEGPGFDFGF